MHLRDNNIRKLSAETYDVLIVGAGINGAVSATALSARGASVALIDKGDFASFTSQESSNLIWGGIKYLETMEFSLVRNLCRSRNRLIESYPSSIKEIRFFTSLEKGFRFPPFLLYLSTLFYWAMGNLFTKAPRFLSARKILQEEPILNPGLFSGGMEYSDAYLVDNDARFVFRFVRRAMDQGCVAANYVESMGSRKKDNIWETKVRDKESGKTLRIRSRILINACGPYADHHNNLSSQKTSHHHLFSRGIHLIVPSLSRKKRVLTFFADDGRPFFVIPMGPASCIGTTDTRVEKLPAYVTAEDRTFVLENINKMLHPTNQLKLEDIIAERCGVRPLVISGSKSKDNDRGDWTSLSRKHAVEADHAAKHLTIFGGKMTDCVNIGEEITDIVVSMGLKLPYPRRMWYGEPSASIRDDYMHQAILMGLDELTPPESSEPLSERLWRRYGAHAFYLLDDIRQDPAMAEALIKGTEYLRCEIEHTARREMVVHLEDFLRRRTKIALIEKKNAIKSAPGLMQACRILFGKNARSKFQEYFRKAKR